MGAPMDEHDEAFEQLVAQAIEALELDGEAGLARVLAAAGAEAAAVREAVARLLPLGLLGGVGGGLPERLGDYRPRRELGRGGMGVVYEASDTRTGELVALKVVRPELLFEPAARVRFQREIDAIARLHHPGLVAILASGNADGLPWYAMPLLVGATLEDAIAALAADGGDVDGLRLHRALGGSGEPPAALREDWWRIGAGLVHQAAVAIAHAHEHGVLHRDLKPANVMVTPAGHAKVFDFGLALVRGGTRLTRTGQEPGSPAYMAPELLRSEPADERTDVYGLAAILWHFLGLRAPFGDGSLPEVARRISTGQWQSLPRACAPPPLLAVLRRGLDRERRYRHASAAAFAADLDAVLGGRAPAAHRLPWRERGRRMLLRHRAFAGALALLVVAAPLLFGVLWWREHQFGVQVATERARADAKVADFERLAAVVRCDGLVAAAARLLPAHPRRHRELAAWLHDADALLAERGALAHTAAELAHAAAGSAERFLADQLTTLVARLDGPLTALRADVARRTRWADEVGPATRQLADAHIPWAEARAAIAASPRYAGCTLTLAADDVLGLVPLGPDPATGLWRCYDLASAWDGVAPLASIPVPRGDDHGRITVDDGTGIVFVLLPGGPCTMGAQNTDPNAPHHDPKVDVDAPRHDLALAPFLIAAHELTRGQWQRLAALGDPLPDPSIYTTGGTFFGGVVTAAHPVENVDWFEANALLTRHGMQLPTEAQWEYAARGGTTTPWCVPFEQLAHAANLADATCKELGGASWDCEPWRDGFVLHAPVGSFAANGFGLFDVAGNVFEWCRDEFADYRDPIVDGDGTRQAKTPRPPDADRDPRRARAVRGGSWMQLADYARSAWRNGLPADQRLKELGLRASRAVR